LPPRPGGRGGRGWARRPASQAKTSTGSDERGQYANGTRPPGRREKPCLWSGPFLHGAPGITDTLIATQDAVILGRRSYDEWAEFWPGSDIQPFASFINAVPKYVATSTPLEREWTNSRVIDGGLVDFVRHLKGRPGGDIGVHGSISVTRTLLAADVVDELRLVIAPTIAGSGQRLFDGLPPIRLETIRSTASPSGHLLVDYRVVR
jgi:dihydrofolate reductase